MLYKTGRADGSHTTNKKGVTNESVSTNARCNTRVAG